MKTIHCNNCEYYVEEYNYSICIRNVGKPLILPDDAGSCIIREEEDYLRDINDIVEEF